MAFPKQGDLLVTAIGTIGEIYIVKDEEPFYFKDVNVLWLKDFTTANSKFLRYVLMFFVKSLNDLSRGAAYSALPIQKLNAHRISLPPLKKQEAIVSQLDSLTAETKHLEYIYKQKLSELETLKKSLLHQAFIGAL